MIGETTEAVSQPDVPGHACIWFNVVALKEILCHQISQSLCENKNEHLQTAQVEVHEGFMLKANHISFKRIFTMFAVISDHHCTQLLGRCVLIPPATSTGMCSW